MKPNLTDERLRTWLNGNQPSRERLCQAVLSMDGRFTEIKPQQPMGGPDGGRDLEATFKNGQLVWAAVGFLNSVSDSSSNRSQARKKFTADLEKAKLGSPRPQVFVFMTNVSLTASAKDRMKKEAAAAGMTVCDVFDRERLRVVLDSPEGFGTRFQYLGIALSDAEQAAFFARWGAKLEEVIHGVATRIDTRMDRLHFMLETAKPLRYLRVLLKFQDGYALPVGSHFRCTFHLTSFFDNVKAYELDISICNEANGRVPSMAAPGWGILYQYHFKRPLHRETTIEPREGAIAWKDPLTQVTMVADLENQFPVIKTELTLGDVDGVWGVLFLNALLAERLAEITLFANEYQVWQADRSSLRFDNPNGSVESSWVFSEDELKDRWVRVMNDGGPLVRFSETTPRRMYEPQPMP